MSGAALRTTLLLGVAGDLWFFYFRFTCFRQVMVLFCL
jgi:hypothetical protein